MLIQNRSFANEIQKQAFINECELAFSHIMSSLTDAITAKAEERVITLSGPTCSGKTVTSLNITHAVTRAGRAMYRISIDDFYRPRGDIIAEAERTGGAPDYDSVRAIDLESFAGVVEGIYAKKTVMVPRYDFVTGTRRDMVAFDSSRCDVVLFEGIQAIYPEITSLLGHYPYVSISTNVRQGICTCGSSFSAREVRLMRRLVRDIRTRGTDPAQTFCLWETTVLPNEDRNILPNEDAAQIKIDSLMPYEINVIRTPLEQTLAQMPPDGEYAEAARSLLERVANVPPIDASYIPPESLYCEFLGIENNQNQ